MIYKHSRPVTGNHEAAEAFDGATASLPRESDPTDFDALAGIVGGLHQAEQLQRRAWQDTFTLAAASHWRRRAAVFEDARPRPDDFNGRATQAELAERDERCRLAAEACRQRADLLEAQLLTVLGEMAA